MGESYATDPAQSRGRLNFEQPSRHRSDFQRDRDRIIHSQAFRRLKHKTQVFVEHEGDYYRTRLTHSIEVAQVARTISRVLGLNEDLAEAVALAHDLGHPPFGHTGEDALNIAMQPFGGFDHNAQALKIVTVLEARYADFDGLNLSWECLEGIAKHNGPVDPASHWYLSNYAAQQDLEFSSHAGLEAQVAALSDDIAYNNHDIDDGLRAGLFCADDLADIPLVGACFAEVDRLHPNLDQSRRQHEALRRVFGAMVEDVITQTAFLIKGSQVETVAEVREFGQPLVRFSTDMWADLKSIRAFLFTRMYRHPDVMKMRDLTAAAVRDLYDILLDAPDLMPADWAASADGDRCHRAHVVGDYIAGMTDRYALQKHGALTGTNAVSGWTG